MRWSVRRRMIASARAKCGFGVPWVGRNARWRRRTCPHSGRKRRRVMVLKATGRAKCSRDYRKGRLLSRRTRSQEANTDSARSGEMLSLSTKEGATSVGRNARRMPPLQRSVGRNAQPQRRRGGRNARTVQPLRAPAGLRRGISVGRNARRLTLLRARGRAKCSLRLRAVPESGEMLAN